MADKYKFEFPDEEILELEIGNKAYQVDIGDEDVLDSIKEFTDFVQDVQDAPESMDSVFEIIDAYKDLIEGILGEGSVDEIFEGRNITAKALEKVCKFLMNSISEYRKELDAERHVEDAPIPMNRVERRAKAKQSRRK